ncbi:hypothetical protein ACIOWE_19925 [Pseudomonas sp. NPDC087598]|uniref:hypothetical protein n=1 Tax=Pseudomonas sp. NPDC087598 TaxID=3364440 RepID=UPI00381B618A
MLFFALTAVRRCAKTVGVFLAVTLLLPVIVVINELTRAPSLVTFSPSGDYRFEVVPASWMIGASGMLYLKLIDLKEPGHTYRTPLMISESLYMRGYEDKEVVGVSWIDFNKADRTFTWSLPSWKEHWANSVISNTPYKVIEN